MKNHVASQVRVFVVEDSAIIRERILADLTSFGNFDVVGVAESQDEAVAAITAQCPDIVVVDIQLKEGSGIEVVRQVRADHHCPPPTIFVLTNYTHPEYRRKCIALGADGFFDKTSDYARFLADIQRH